VNLDPKLPNRQGHPALAPGTRNAKEAGIRAYEGTNVREYDGTSNSTGSQELASSWQQAAGSPEAAQ